MAYNGSIDLISGVKPKNNGSFPLVHAKDIYVDDNTRLDTKLNDLAENGGARLIAPIFDETAAYDTGSYVVYDGELYLLPEGHTANTTWTNTVKTQVMLSDQVSEIKETVDEIGPEVYVGSTEPSDETVMLWVNPSGVPSDENYFSVIDGMVHITYEEGE